MPDHWGYVFAAYGVAAVVLAAYWRGLVRGERELTTLRPRRPVTTPARSAAGPESDFAQRHAAPVSTPPRSKPPSRPPDTMRR